MPRLQPRVLLFVHDGYGLGHLQRMARIAAALQGPSATLLVTGHRDAATLVRHPCEVLLLPSWVGLRPHRAAVWGRELWMQATLAEALQFRSELFSSVVKAFDPDAILVDYLPFGIADELRSGLHASRARKYWVLRGVVDRGDRE